MTGKVGKCLGQPMGHQRTLGMAMPSPNTVFCWCVTEGTQVLAPANLLKVNLAWRDSGHMG